jgi:hypothetical protein
MLSGLRVAFRSCSRIALPISDARSSPFQSRSRIARIAPPTSSSFAEEKRLHSLLLSTPGAD